MTEYREIEGFPYYRVGDDGTVWSRRVFVGGHNGLWAIGNTWRPLRPQRQAGCLAVSLCREGKVQQHKLHHLVLEAFVGPRPDGLEGCHGDGDFTNNSLDNLRWDTPLANADDKRRHGTLARGEKMSRLAEVEIREIRRRLALGEGAYDIASAFKVCAQTIYNIKSGKRWAWLT